MTDAATSALQGRTAADEALDPVDREALDRAVQLMLADRELGELVRAKLRDEPWIAVARFCSFSLQFDSLQLRPWMTVPADADGSGRDLDADALAARLRAAGLSRFEPDPAAALAAKEKLGARPTDLLPTMGTKPKRPRA